MTRVVVEYSPNLFGIIGPVDERECAPTLEQVDASGARHLFYRSFSKRHYVHYKPAVAGHGESTFDPRQR